MIIKDREGEMYGRGNGIRWSSTITRPQSGAVDPTVITQSPSFSPTIYTRKQKKL